MDTNCSFGNSHHIKQTENEQHNHCDSLLHGLADHQLVDVDVGGDLLHQREGLALLLRLVALASVLLLLADFTVLLVW